VPTAGGQQLIRNFRSGDTLTGKLTRGNWDHAESDAEGFPAPNRTLILLHDTTVRWSISGWTGVTPKRHTASRHVVLASGSFPSRYLGNSRKVWAWMPESYAHSPGKRYPVIYMQDGQNLFDRATTAFGTEWRVDETLDSMTAAGSPECIVIGVESGAQRMREYLPYASSRFPEAHGADYAKFIVEELVPWVDARYRTLPDAGNRVIAGSSLGGLISLYIAFSHPGVFGGVGAFSTAYWVAPDIYSLAEKNLNAFVGHYYLYAGDAESAELVDETKKMAAILRKNPRLLVQEAYRKGGQHREADWQGPFREMMLHLPWK
jgi:predicted alpha/beta superfamily hydrolase